MTKLILVSHEDLAEHMLKTAEFFLGKMTDVYTAGIRAGDSPEDFETLLREFVGNVQEQVLFLCDIKSGTPFNVACKVSYENPNIRVLYGMNLAMVLECLSARDEMNAPELTEHIKEVMPKTYGSFDL